MPASGERTMVSGEQGRKGKLTFHYLLICTWDLHIMISKIIADPKKL